MNNNPSQLKEELADSRVESMMTLSKMINYFTNATSADQETVDEIANLELQINDLALQIQKLMYDEIDEVDSERN